MLTGMDGLCIVYFIFSVFLHEQSDSVSFFRVQPLEEIASVFLLFQHIVADNLCELGITVGIHAFSYLERERTGIGHDAVRVNIVGAAYLAYIPVSYACNGIQDPCLAIDNTDIAVNKGILMQCHGGGFKYHIVGTTVFKCSPARCALSFYNDGFQVCTTLVSIIS